MNRLKCAPGFGRVFCCVLVWIDCWLLGFVVEGECGEAGGERAECFGGHFEREAQEDIEFVGFADVGDEDVGCDEGADSDRDSCDVEGEGWIGWEQEDGGVGDGGGDGGVEDRFGDLCACVEHAEVGIFDGGVDEDDGPEDVEDGACDGGGVDVGGLGVNESCGEEDREDEDREADGGDEVEDEEFVEAALGVHERADGGFDGAEDHSRGDELEGGVEVLPFVFVVDDADGGGGDDDGAGADGGGHEEEHFD